MDWYPDRIPEQFRCPICDEIPAAEIYQCKNGHIICKRCYNSSKPWSVNCPQCRVILKVDGTVIRNRALESFLESAPARILTKEAEPPVPLVEIKMLNFVEKSSGKLLTSSVFRKDAWNPVILSHANGSRFIVSTHFNENEKSIWWTCCPLTAQKYFQYHVVFQIENYSEQIPGLTWSLHVDSIKIHPIDGDDIKPNTLSLLTLQNYVNPSSGVVSITPYIRVVEEPTSGNETMPLGTDAFIDNLQEFSSAVSQLQREWRLQAFHEYGNMNVLRFIVICFVAVNLLLVLVTTVSKVMVVVCVIIGQIVNPLLIIGLFCYAMKCSLLNEYPS